MHGAKGSVKNRIYQFWLIRLYLKRKEKRKNQRLLKKKQKEAMRRKRQQEIVASFHEQPALKLYASPFLNPVTVTLYPIGKKPDQVIEVHEKKKVGIGENLKKENTLKQVAHITEDTKLVIQDVQKHIEKKETAQMEEVKKELKQDLMKIESIQNRYEQIKGTDISNMVLFVKEKKTKIKVKDQMKQLEEAKQMCKQELKKIETIFEEKQKTVVQKSKENELENRKKTEKVEKKRNNKKSELENSKAVLLPMVGGTLIAFPALLQKGFPVQKKPKKNMVDNHSPMILQTIKEPIKTNPEEDIHFKLKLYQNKLKTSKETEILIGAQIKSQEDYLKSLQEKIDKLDITVKTEYHFRGIDHLLSNILKFALGVLTLPFSKKNLFGTAVGITLINNSIRGIKNSFRNSKTKVSYLGLEDFTKAIQSEKMSLYKINDLIIDSLWQVKDLKSELEQQFYLKIPLEEYEKMKRKLDVMELKLLDKQKEIELMQEKLVKAEEKNKVKVKILQQEQK